MGHPVRPLPEAGGPGAKCPRLRSLARRLAILGIVLPGLMVSFASQAQEWNVSGDLPLSTLGCRTPRPSRIDTISPDRPGLRVASWQELRAALSRPAEEVPLITITRDSVIEIPGRASSEWTVLIERDVVIRGERGVRCSRPKVRFREIPTERGDVFLVRSGRVTFDGIEFAGPFIPAVSRSSSQPGVSAIRAQMNPSPANSLVVSDSVFRYWSFSGVAMEASQATLSETRRQTCGGVLYSEIDYSVFQPQGPCPVPDRDTAKRFRVERSYFERNARNGTGYGISVGGGIHVLALSNVFTHNRHAIASTGMPHSGYTAKFNYVLEGGFTEGGSYNQHFDVHGSSVKDRGYGGLAGHYFEITSNTFRGDQSYGIFRTRPAFMVRGKPNLRALLADNVALHKDRDALVRIKTKVPCSQQNFAGCDYLRTTRNRVITDNNRYSVDHSSELLSGDFDGDGRSDVLVTTGTAWFVSRQGRGHWEYLRASVRTADGLKVADVDRDGIDDVLFQDQAGLISYVSGGLGNAVPITTSNAPLSEITAGDFDGDDEVDLFHAHGGPWRLWTRGSGRWTQLNDNRFAPDKLLVGSFDRTKGLDVLVATGGDWSIASGARGQLTRHGEKRSSSFRHARALDVNGDGQSDVVLRDGLKWLYSLFGTGSLREFLVEKELATSRPGPVLPDIRRMVVGRFDPDGPREQLTSMLLTHFRPQLASQPSTPLPNGLYWLAPQRTPALQLLSLSEMR